MRSHKQLEVTPPIHLPRIFRGGEMNVVSVTGGKGGVGKSSVAVNLALGLKSLGGRVLLVDGDLGLANADQLLGVQAPSTMLDVIKGNVQISEAIIETPWGISLLAASSGRKEMAELDAVTMADLVSAIREIKGKFDLVVIDTAAGIGETSVGLAQAGDIVLAVITPDPTSVRDGFSIMKILAKDRGVRRISLVANMVSSHAEGVDLFRRISSVSNRFLPLRLSLGGVIVRDPCMADSVLSRQPAFVAHPGSFASRQIAKLAAHVVTLNRELLEHAELSAGEEEPRP